MKKDATRLSWLVFGALVLVTLILAPLFGSNALAAGKTIELTYASYLSESAIHSVQARMWARELEKRTNGRVKFTRWQWGGAICSPNEQANCIARGMMDAGYAAPGYKPAELRLGTLSELVFVSDVPGADVRARVDLYKNFPAYRKEYRDFGLEVMTFHPTSQGIIGLSKRKTINSSADMKGIKSHTYGSIADVMQKVGMVPVAMSIGDVYESMSRGVIDAWWAVFWYIPPSKFFEVTGTIIDPRLGMYASPHNVMCKKTYDSLPADVKQIIEDLREEQIVPELKALESLEDKAIAQIKKSSPNMKFVQFSDKARDEWMQKADVNKFFERFIKEREARSPQAREFFKQFQALVKKYEPEFKKYYTSPFKKLNAKIVD
ncbi:TRAP transporter substrate-binding protein DctP [Thermodesulfobacteriota bacterium]